MDCRHTILIDTRLLWLKIRTNGDYNYKRQISLKEWVQLWRYEIGLFRRSKSPWGYRFWINKSKSIWG